MPRARGAVALTLGLIGAAATLPARAETPETLFDRGSDAYQAGRFEEAAEAFRAILQFRVRDPRVEYNLANAEFKRGRVGEAILHYERARRLDPTDPDIRDNLSYARSQCADLVEPPQLPPVVEAVVALQDSLGPDRQAWAVLVVCWALGALLAWSLAAPGRFSAAHGWWLAALLLVLGAVAFSWYSTLMRLDGSRTAVVLAPSVEVLAGPGANNATLFTVHEGLTLEVRAEREEWLHVSLPNGINGWLPRDAVGRVG
ncbi:MAG TPA: tetratricopeptide repeat protein [Candidatus Polarisedimenticolaceae bacterium]|nr:tetratricopeptide repeat protein [Candidatus Polarisedimenticolaceae bacterium]